MFFPIISLAENPVIAVAAGFQEASPRLPHAVRCILGIVNSPVIYWDLVSVLAPPDDHFGAGPYRSDFPSYRRSASGSGCGPGVRDGIVLGSIVECGVSSGLMLSVTSLGAEQAERANKLKRAIVRE